MALAARKVNIQHLSMTTMEVSDSDEGPKTNMRWLACSRITLILGGLSLVFLVDQ